VILAAAVFLKRMTDKTTVEICQRLVEENEDEPPEVRDAELLQLKNIPPDVVVFEIRGPFFYSVADLLDEALLRLGETPRVFILRMHKTPLIDATGLRALKQFADKCKKKGILFLLSDVDAEKRQLFIQSGIEHAIGKDSLFQDFGSALSRSQEKL